MRYIKHGLYFTTLYLPLSIVCAVEYKLPSGETIEQWVWFGKVLPFMGGCIIAVCLILSCNRSPMRKVLHFPNFFIYLSWSLMLLGIIEALWGMRQLYGFTASGHSRYALTGSFFNPGPYAGYLAMILPICLYHYLRLPDQWRYLCKSLKAERIVAAVSGILILCVLPSTMSRSAWIAGAISCAWVVYMLRDKQKWSTLWRRYKKRHVLLGIGVIFTLLMTVAGMFLLKPDSALGRLFMWKVTCRAIAAHPWGCQEGFVFAYGEAQSLFFSSGDYAAWEERVAGSPEYAFNEYLEFALTNGIVMCILMLLLVFGCLWIGVKLHRYGICGALISLLIFSFFSYPIHLPAIIVTGVCLLLACGIGDVIGKLFILCLCVIVWNGGYAEKWIQERNDCRDWMNARVLYLSGAYKAANRAYEKVYPALEKKGRFLFEYGHSLHKSGYYQKSSELLNQARMYNNDPMILNIIGKNYQALREYKSAEKLYLSSINRLPNRIYPYYLLAKLYCEPEYRNREKFEAMKWNVLNRKPKVHSTAIEEMRIEVEELKKTGVEVTIQPKYQ